MKKQLIDALKKMDETEYIMLGYYIKTADMCRGIMNRHNIDDETMARKLDLSPDQFRNFKFACFDYTIRDWAKLQAIDTEYSVEAARKESQITITAKENYKYEDETKQYGSENGE